MELSVLGIEVKVNNKRERSFVRIVNAQIERIVEYWTTDKEWEEDFRTRRTNHWMITEIEGELSAMYFMNMIKDPVTSYKLFTSILNEVKSKMSEAA